MQEDQNQQTTDAGNDPLAMTQGDVETPVLDPAGEQTLPNPEAGAAGEAAERQGGGRKVRQGVVVSNKMSKSIVVAVVRRVRHPLYKKYFNKTKKYMAHDENNEAAAGDTVRIVETRPLSARKRWRLDAIVEKAK